MAANCVICSASQFVLPLSCGCSSFCQECITSWLREQLKKQFVSELSQLVCPVADARHEIPLEELLEITKGSEFEAEIEQMTLRMTLRSISGMVFCPMENCDYVGWIKVAEKCVHPVECEGCGESWVEEELLPAWKKVAKRVYRIVFVQDESFNLIWKDLWTESCPSCCALIEKNGGCPHMVCFRCHLDFCWNCMRPYRNHDSDYCNLRIVIYAGFYLILGLLLVLKLMWVAGVVYDFLAQVEVVLGTAGMVGLGATMGGLIASFDNCACRMFLLLLFVCIHILILKSLDSGMRIAQLEAAMFVSSLHCTLATSYLKYEV